MIAQFFPHTFFVLIGIMMMFLATKGRASTIVLYVAVVVQGVVVVAAYALSTYVSGLSVVVVYINYLMPSILMLNFVLYAVVLNDIVDRLKGKLKVLTAASLVSYGLFMCTVFFERQIYRWYERTFTFRGFGWFFTILVWIIAALWILGGLVAFGGMLVYALKTAQGRTKKIWAVIAFLCPIVGSVIYLFVQLIRGLLGTRRRA